MEGSFAEELYSESLQVSKLQLNPASTSTGYGDDFLEEEEDEDGSFWGDSHDLDREWERRREQFHTIGYRDGLIAGKEAIAQDGFNVGFKESVDVGFDWGIVRGITSAFACLPNVLKERLVDDQEKRNQFQALHEAVHSLSTTDALELFHDDIIAKKAAVQTEHAETTFDSDSLQNNTSDHSLGSYVGDLSSLLHECSAVDSHLSVK